MLFSFFVVITVTSALAAYSITNVTGCNNRYSICTTDGQCCLGLFCKPHVSMLCINAIAHPISSKELGPLSSRPCKAHA
ncbi:uncharacterized protein EDB93DRAFT_1176523 [Suillus bovinus]|uniref:uncharacterized protein n=1 Tax=Suillus bovinus TaxID=48563 RepID=UPI001B86367B|nr:uncharacterized protein EDB93DRAFT_1176523 [Suillus bovinus]KAG2132420.1 hypothetical protein EDB93DRAFT_1176523 [Suillus bovinus]